MRGQISAEYMMLFMVSLSLLAVSAASLGAIKDSAERGLQRHSFHNSAIALSNAINEVCAMGEGNRRPVELSRPLDVQPEHTDDGWLIRMSGDVSIVRHSLCEAESASLAEGAVFVENRDGKARFTER